MLNLNPREHYDSLEIIAGYALNPVAAVSDMQGGIELIGLDGTIDVAGMLTRGVRLLACVGFINGRSQMAMEYPLPTEVATAIGSAYAAYRRGLLETEPEYDWNTRSYRP